VTDLLTVDVLKVHFFTQSGVAPAVDGIDFTVRPRETLGLVGESGSGKTMASLAVLRLVPPPARIVAGSLHFQGHDLLALDNAAMHGLRGKSIAMIFQNPAFSAASISATRVSDVSVPMRRRVVTRASWPPRSTRVGGEGRDAGLRCTSPR